MRPLLRSSRTSAVSLWCVLITSALELRKSQSARNHAGQRSSSERAQADLARCEALSMRSGRSVPCMRGENLPLLQQTNDLCEINVGWKPQLFDGLLDRE